MTYLRVSVHESHNMPPSKETLVTGINNCFWSSVWGTEIWIWSYDARGGMGRAKGRLQNSHLLWRPGNKVFHQPAMASG